MQHHDWKEHPLRRDCECTCPIHLLTHPQVREAILSLQAGDKEGGRAIVEADVTLADDGNPRSFNGFADNAARHMGFTRVERINWLAAPLGLVTPSQAFGADFVLSLPGCTRMDTPSTSTPAPE